MWLTPASTARRKTAIACSWSLGGPITPGPGSCIAPNPTRRTALPEISYVVAISPHSWSADGYKLTRGRTATRTCRISKARSPAVRKVAKAQSRIELG